MTPEHWRQVEDLFHAARERALRDRDLFLEHVTADDTVRRAVRGLLDQPDDGLLRGGLSGVLTALVAPLAPRADAWLVRTGDRSRRRHDGRRVSGPRSEARPGCCREDSAPRRSDAILIAWRASSAKPRVLAALNHVNIADALRVGRGGRRARGSCSSWSRARHLPKCSSEREW